jgi:hypothetical protein
MEREHLGGELDKPHGDPGEEQDGDDEHDDDLGTKERAWSWMEVID